MGPFVWGTPNKAPSLRKAQYLGRPVASCLVELWIRKFVSPAGVFRV